MNHGLKTWPEYFEKVITDEKRFEIRKNDRDFKVGDKLILIEFDPVTQKYTGRETERTIIYILDKQPFVPVGYVCMSIE
ncbi:MAG: DUF3850 domain-containing protein [Candidatus Magnetobacterium sp. LHC-1]